MDRQDLSPFLCEDGAARSETLPCRGEHLILCGLKRSGKTQLARVLARRLDLPMFDTDHLIEKREGKSCREIMRTRGEEAFRSLEYQLVLELQKQKKSVIALGGGTLLREETAFLLRQMGKIFFCFLDPEEVLRRWHLSPLPTFIVGHTEEEIRAMIDERIAVCKRWADQIFSYEELHGQ